MKKDNEINIFKYYNIFDHSVLLSYRGPFEKYTLLAFNKNLQELTCENQKVTKKLFKVFIELTQNISYYSAETNSKTGNNTGVGIFVFGELENYYTFTTGNLVCVEDGITLAHRCRIINSLNRVDLRKRKREQRAISHGTKVGASIGLIQAALISTNSLDTEIIPVDNEFSFFSISVTFEKK